MKNSSECNDKRVFIDFFIFGERKLSIHFLGVGAQDQSDRGNSSKDRHGGIFCANKKTASRNGEAVRMRKMGFEPTRAIAHKTLNLARLPFRHFRKYYRRKRRLR